MPLRLQPNINMASRVPTKRHPSLTTFSRVLLDVERSGSHRDGCCRQLHRRGGPRETFARATKIWKSEANIYGHLVVD